MREQGEYARAHELFTESLALFRELGDQNEFASALNGQGDTLFDQGDLVAAKQAHQEVIELTRATGWGTITAFALSNLGSIVYMQGDTARGRALLEESMAWFRDEGVNSDLPPGCSGWLQSSTRKVTRPRRKRFSARRCSGSGNSATRAGSPRALRSGRTL